MHVSNMDSTSTCKPDCCVFCVDADIDRLPFEFWRVLHAEYGIVVYPSALTEDIDVQGLGVDVTFMDAYCGHIGTSLWPHGCCSLADRVVVMYGRCCGSEPPVCPMQMLQEPPPVYSR
jgi:hypothetical protein